MKVILIQVTDQSRNMLLNGKHLLTSTPYASAYSCPTHQQETDPDYSHFHKTKTVKQMICAVYIQFINITNKQLGEALVLWVA